MTSSEVRWAGIVFGVVIGTFVSVAFSALGATTLVANPLVGAALGAWRGGTGRMDDMVEPPTRRAK